MTGQTVKTSNLGITTTLSANDRVVVLTNPASSAQTQTIAANNFVSSVANLIPYANASSAGVFKVGAGLSMSVGGVLSAPVSLATNTSVGVIKGDSNTVIISNGTISVATSTDSFNPNFCTNTGNTLSVASQSGSYTKTGKICYFRAFVQFGNSTYADGSGQYQITLPFPSAATISIRGGTLHNTNTASVYHIGGVLDVSTNTTALPLYYTGSTTDLAWKNTTPVSWMTGNTSHFDISGVYETT
jgi:hypothetical protein